MSISDMAKCVAKTLVDSEDVDNIDKILTTYDTTEEPDVIKSKIVATLITLPPQEVESWYDSMC